MIDGEKGLRAISGITDRRSPACPTPISRKRALAAAARPLAESLEARRLLSTAVWTGAAGDNNWATVTNWSGGSGFGGAPGAGDDVSIGAGFSTINIPNGTSSLDSINSASPLQLSSGVMTVGGGTTSSSLSDGFTIAGSASFNGPAPISITNLNLSGDLRGSGNVTVNGTCSWTSGDMFDTGTTTIANGATLSLLGSRSPTVELDRSLVNNGTINWTEASSDTGETVTIGGAIQNNGTFDAAATASGGLAFSSANIGTSPSFTNAAAATLNITGPGGLAFNQNVSFNNVGGTVANNGQLVINGGGNEAGTFSGTGSFTIGAGTATFTNTTLSALTLNGGEADFNGNCSIGSLTEGSGALGGSGTLALSGTSTWATGTMNGTGTTVLLAGATLNLIAVQNKSASIARSFVNDGAIIWTANAVGNAGWLNLSGSFLNNGSFTTTSYSANEALEIERATGTPSFTNASGATFTVNGPGGLIFSTVPFNNAGTVVVNNGQLELGGGAETGSFSGAGSITVAGSTTTFTGITVSFLPVTVSYGTATFTDATVSSLNVTGGEADFNGNSSVGTLDETAGTVGGSGTLTVNGIYSWAGGIMIGTGTTTVPDDATLNIQGIYFSNVAMDRTLINDGTINWIANTTSASETMYVAGAIDNYGKFNVTLHTGSTLSFSNDNIGTHPFTNEAGSEFNIAGAGSVQFNIPFNNAGDVSLSSSGEVLNLYGGGSHTSGAFSLPAGTMLGLEGTQSFDATSTITGSGEVGVYTGLTTFNAINLANPLSLTEGEADFNGASSVASLVQNSGTLGGSGNVTINGTLTWTGGTMSGTGTTTIAYGATLQTSSPTFIDRTLVNNGTINWTYNLSVYGQEVVSIAGAIDNYGTFNAIPSAGGKLYFYGYNSGSFTNEIGGAFNVTGVGITQFVIPFNNAGSVTLSSGQLVLQGGGNESSGFIGQSGATLVVYNQLTFTAAASITGDINVQISSATGDDAGNLITTGTVQVDSYSTWSIEGQFSAGQLNLASGTLTLNGASTTALNLNGGTLAGSGNLTLNGTSTWTGGSMSGAGTTTIASGATLDISGISYAGVNRTLVNDGTVNWTEDSGDNGESVSVSGTIDNYGTFNVAPHSGGSLQFYSSGNFNNEIGGAFNSTAAGDTQFRIPFNNAGGVTISSGELDLTAGGKHTSGFTGQPGVMLEFNGKHTFTTAATITGNINVQVDGGSADYPGDLITTGTVQFDSSFANWAIEGHFNVGQLNLFAGTLNLNGASTTTLNQSGGTLGGNGALSLVGTSFLAGGTLAGAGTTTIANGATLDLLGVNNGSATVNRTLINNGTINWTEVPGGDAETMDVGAAIHNYGTFNAITSSGGVLSFGYSNIGPGVASFTNESAGIFISSGAGNTQLNIPFNNAGGVAVNVGQLSLTFGGSQTSGFTGQPGATLEFNGRHTFTPAATITGNVNVRVDGGAADYPDDLTTSGTVQFNNGTWSFEGQLDAGQLNLTGGTLNLNNNSTTTVNQTGGTLSDSSTINGSVNSSGGIIHPGSPTGALTINGDYTQSGTGQLQTELDGAASTGAFGQLVVNGTVSLGGSISVTCGYLPAHGDSFVVVSNDGSDPIGGTFNGLPEGSVVSVNGAYFRLSYDGGNGNDVSLTAVNAPSTLSATGPHAIFAGDLYTLNLSYVDSDPNQSWSINWGDGSPVQVIAGNSTTATHTFAVPSGATPYSIQSWATNSEGLFAATPDTVLVNAAPLLNNGLLSLTGTSGNDSVSFTNSGGLLTLNLDGASKQYNSSAVTKVAYTSNGGNDTINLSGAIPATLNLASGNSTVTNSDSAPVFVAAGTGKTTINATSGTTIIPANTSTGVRQLNFASISISAGAKVVFANTSSTLGDYSNHTNRTLAIVDAGGLNIASGGILDLGENSMLLKYVSVSKTFADSMVSSLLTSGADGGAWDGTGITSSEANFDAFNGAAARAVGWADQLDVGVNSFEGDSADVADGNEIMIKFTYYGDTDLDGRVASSDSANFSTGVHLTGNAYWEFGDFDYSGGKPTASDSQAFSTGLAAYKTFGLL